MDLLRNIWKTNRAAASRAMETIMAANFRTLHCGITSLGETFSVRFIPSGVISKAHAMTKRDRETEQRQHDDRTS